MTYRAESWNMQTVRYRTMTGRAEATYRATVVCCYRGIKYLSIYENLDCEIHVLSSAIAIQLDQPRSQTLAHTSKDRLFQPLEIYRPPQNVRSSQKMPEMASSFCKIPQAMTHTPKTDANWKSRVCTELWLRLQATIEKKCHESEPNASVVVYEARLQKKF